MSHALYQLGGLRFWTEEEIDFRDFLTKRLKTVLENALTQMNPAWKFIRVEGPVLAPRDRINPNYGEDDLFVTNHEAMGDHLCLSPETTDTSYVYARHLMTSDKRFKYPPFCVWQTRKSFRRENTDGATWGKLRGNEFYQLEFQCVYSTKSFAPYKEAAIKALVTELNRYYSAPWILSGDGGPGVIVEPSDRLPSYSRETTDLMAWHNGERREVASVSIRTDFGDGFEVLEVAFGLDRLVEIANVNGSGASA